MSYILEALKKAETERQLGELPGILTPTSHHSIAPNHGIPLDRRTGLLIGCAVVIGLVTWQFNKVKSADNPMVVASLKEPSKPVSDSHNASQTSQPSVASQPLTPLIPQAHSKPPPKKRTTEAPHVKPTSVSDGGRRANTATLTSAVKLDELPTTIRQALPPLIMTGTLYADKAADRILLIDKATLHEGEEVAPGLVVKQISAKSAVLSYKGYVFRIGS
jgi:general secretion pathway protein B